MNVIITGATKGIGRAIADLFASHGHNIYFCARTPQDIALMVDTLSARYPDQVFKGYAVDMSSKHATQSFAQELLQRMDSIDILVNNAGMYLPGNVSDEPEGTLEAQLSANLLSAYHITRKLLPKMISKGEGHIFNICSIASLKAYPGGGAYSISKYALLGFSDNLRYELQEKGIKVTAVLPGATFSDSWAGSGILPERIMEANDIAESVYSAATLSRQAVVERIILRPLLGDL